MVCPPSEVIVSPSARPALAAGSPATTPSISTPLVVEPEPDVPDPDPEPPEPYPPYPRPPDPRPPEPHPPAPPPPKPVLSLLPSETDTPRKAVAPMWMAVDPSPATIWFASDSASLIGMENAVVAAPSESDWPWNWYSEEAAVSMPTTWPYAFTREPPESPGSIGALLSIRPVSCSCAPDSSSEAVMDWSSPVTVPVATDGVPPLPSALPRATTVLPTATELELPRLAMVRPEAFSSWITATSEPGS